MTPKEVAAEVNHNLQPVIGWMRLALADDKPLSAAQMESAVEKMRLAIKAAEATTKRGE